MKLIDMLIPKSLKILNSKFNKNIEIFFGVGEPTLIVDGLVESGFLLTHIWKTGIKNLLPKTFKPKTILILGLGGGSNTKLVSKYFPEAHITAVEIDDQMVEIAQKYYGLDKVKNLKIIIGDAESFACNLRSENYDLILVDCFVGKLIPQALQKMSFINYLYNHGKYVLINRIWYNEHHLETVFFLRELSRHFFFLRAGTKTNVIVSLV
jgi:spermidine synthase